MGERPRFFDDLAGVAGGAFSALAGMREEVESTIRARVDEAIRKLDLVKREDLEAVQEMAAQARSDQTQARSDQAQARAGQDAAEAKAAAHEAKSAALEARLHALEAKVEALEHAAHPPAHRPAHSADHGHGSKSAGTAKPASTTSGGASGEKPPST